ncbi:MAG TPA: ATP-binding protein, partial [Stellaceae bacterium]|nr:ATP-binding protein [Stellaceae bacterium]
SGEGRGGGVDVDVRIRRHDGLYRWFKVKAVPLAFEPITEAEGEARLWLGTSSEIHDIIEAREALTLNSERLEALVAERTSALEAEMEERRRAEAALYQAQKMEAVGQLTGGVAHDFNNLLTTIIGNLELINEGFQPGDRRRHHAEAALRAANSGARLTQHLLAFSRRQHLEPQLVEIDTMLAEALPLYRRAVGGAIELTLEAGSDLWPSILDAAQLESVVLNLLINARDAMPNGGSLKVTANNVTFARPEPDLVAGDYVKLAVADTGTGIAPEILPRVFEPFFTTKALGQGSGLGLSIVYGFARQSGGAVRIDTALGRGATVVLFLPRACNADAPSPSPWKSEQRPAAVPPAKGETILLVEDEEDVRQVAAEALTDVGYRVLVAGTGAEALSLLQARGPPDLLMSDVVMPGGTSGLDLAREVSRLHPKLPILLVTGYASLPEAPIAEMERYVFLQKPFRPSELRAKIGRMLARE